MTERSAGILCHVSSLWGKYGIGSLGKEAYRFAKILAKNGVKYWQILPLVQTGFGDSPYQSVSCDSGNPYFIDLETLKKEGLLTKEELKAAERKGEVDYASLYAERYDVLRTAYSRFFFDDPDFRSYVKSGASEDYALFMTAKQVYGGRFCDWSEELKRRDADALEALRTDHHEEYLFWQFTQYEFRKQWFALKGYCNGLGIKIMGDLPLYVAYDSADVWNSPQYFLLDEKGMPKEVAGVPPDAFSCDGQLWGNPLYDWDEMKKDGFAWWKKRFGAALDMYDLVRIDHFRGFSDYYAIPFGERTARNGRWKSAPGKELFAELKTEFPNANIIAEDLGVIDERVRDLLMQTGFPGMKIAQFGFSEDNSGYNPENYPQNCVAYTGTHDNPTTKTWAKNLNAAEKARFHKSVRRHIGETDSIALIRSLLCSAAETVIIPMQDYLSLGEEGRVNTPSTLGRNWVWRVKQNYKRHGKQIKRLCALR